MQLRLASKVLVKLRGDVSLLLLFSKVFVFQHLWRMIGAKPLNIRYHYIFTNPRNRKSIMMQYTGLSSDQYGHSLHS